MSTVRAGPTTAPERRSSHVYRHHPRRPGGQSCPVLDRDDTPRGGRQISALRRAGPMTHLAWWPYIVLAGAGVGICTGLFGVGGSSVATPVLALLGAPGLIAVASPLPATIPSAAVGAIPYISSREARPHAAAWSVLGGVPGTIAEALLSRLAGAFPRPAERLAAAPAYITRPGPSLSGAGEDSSRSPKPPAGT